MTNKKTKGDYLEIILVIGTFIFATVIFSEWDGFKDGFMTAFN